MKYMLTQADIDRRDRDYKIAMAVAWIAWGGLALFVGWIWYKTLWG